MKPSNFKIPMQTNITLIPEEYLSQIIDPLKKGIIAEWFEFLNVNFAMIMRMNQVSVSHFPEIRIRDNESLNAEGSPYVIYISRGLIDYIYSLETDIFECVQGPMPNNIVSSKWLATTMAFSWIIAHEFLHGARQHNDRAKKLSATGKHTPEILSQATEYDADLSAVAHVFRLMQVALFQPVLTGSSSILPTDLEYREMTFCAIFNVLRSLPQSSESLETHPSHAQRITNIAAKLATIKFNSKDLFDRDFQLPQTKERAQFLFKCLVRCESHFQKKNGSKYGDLKLELVNPPTSFPFISAWEDMDEQVLEEYHQQVKSNVRHPFRYPTHG